MKEEDESHSHNEVEDVTFPLLSIKSPTLVLLTVCACESLFSSDIIIFSVRESRKRGGEGERVARYEKGYDRTVRKKQS